MLPLWCWILCVVIIIISMFMIYYDFISMLFSCHFILRCVVILFRCYFDLCLVLKKSCVIQFHDVFRNFHCLLSCYFDLRYFLEKFLISFYFITLFRNFTVCYFHVIPFFIVFQNFRNIQYDISMLFDLCCCLKNFHVILVYDTLS